MNITSFWRTIVHGMPQDSIRGPLLFLLYVNDLSGVVDGFAKDTLSRSSKELKKNII